MADNTQAGFAHAIAAHEAARGDAQLSGQDPDQVDRSGLEAAARTHLAAVDPAYLDSIDPDTPSAAAEPSAVIIAPALQEKYLRAKAAAEAAPDDPIAQAERNRAEEAVAAASRARRVIEGRPFGPLAGG